MKNLGLLILAFVLITSCNQNTGKTDGNKTVNTTVVSTDTIKDGVFIRITESYNDPHRVLMPLKIAVLMAKDKDVIVYMDIHAVELLVKGAKDINFADFESAQTYIKQLASMKVGVYACPTCLKIAGFKPEDLLDGVQVAQKEKFFNFTKGRIITLDY
ncbi:MAG: DsrE family protein [Bacteroidia bacterium]|nr:DsrE family protein [Bacteroidia bacterium]